MKTKNKSNLPKIRLTLIHRGKKIYLRPSSRKIQFFLRNKAKHFFKNGDSITITVAYKTGGSNSGTYDSIEDLSWAFQAFVKEYTK